jgi:1-deoxy-D-xylulose 5-phosphate reductoisomerase
MTYLHHHFTTTEKGIIGSAASIGSSALSMFSHIETALRIGGLIIGILVGLATLISVVADIKKKKKDLNK